MVSTFLLENLIVLGQLELLNVLRVLQNWTRFVSNLHSKYLTDSYEKCLVTIFEPYTLKK